MMGRSDVVMPEAGGKRKIFWVFALGFLMLSVPAVQATNHDVRINEVMGALNGDPTIQFVEMVSRDPGQKEWGPGLGNPDFGIPPDSPAVGRAMLQFFDHHGDLTGEFVFPADPPGGIADDFSPAFALTTLIATEAFELATGIQPDFIIPQHVMAPGGQVRFTGNPASCCKFDADLRLSYGDFEGDTGQDVSFGVASAMPVCGTTSLSRFQRFRDEFGFPIVGDEPTFGANRNNDYAVRPATPSSSGALQRGLLAEDVEDNVLGEADFDSGVGILTNHFTRINEVMAGFNGDPTIQFVEMVSEGNGQKLWGPQFGDSESAAMLEFYDENGALIDTFKFPNNPPFGASTVLIATQAFANHTQLLPDFIISANVMAPSGQVRFTGNPEADFTFGVDHRLSYGDFAGCTGQAPDNGVAPALPTGCPAQSLSRFENFSFSDDPLFGANNNANFRLDPPTPSSTSAPPGNFDFEENRAGQFVFQCVGGEPLSGVRIVVDELTGVVVDCFVPGNNVVASIEIIHNIDDPINIWSVEEQIPAGWVFVAADFGGVFDGVDKVSWSAAGEPPLAVSYVVAPVGTGDATLGRTSGKFRPIIAPNPLICKY